MRVLILAAASSCRLRGAAGTLKLQSPTGLSPGASLGTGESWPLEGSECGVGGICGAAEVPAPCLERGFRPAVLRGGPR